MHAVLVPSWYPRHADDPRGTFFREQAEVLVGTGHQVTVLAGEVTTPDPRRPASIRPALTDALRTVAAEEAGVRVLRFRLPVPVPGIPGTAARVLSALTARIARTELRDVDVVHAHSVSPGAFVARAVAHELEVPWLLTEHRPSSVTVPRRPRFARAVREVVVAADVLTAVSDGLARAMESHYGLRAGSVLTLPNPLSADFAAAASEVRPREVDSVLRFLHLSHLAPIKRVDDVISAFRARRAEGPSELVIAGGAPERVQELAARHGAAIAVRPPARGEVRRRTGSDIVLVGHTRRQDVPQLMATADRFVLASAQESFGIVLAESLSLGVPVIATDTWGARSVIGDAPSRGVVVPVGDVAALSAAMDAAISARAAGEVVPVEGLGDETLHRFGPAAYAARAAELWRAALEHSRPGRTTA